METEVTNRMAVVQWHQLQKEIDDHLEWAISLYHIKSYSGNFVAPLPYTLKILKCMLVSSTS